MFNHSAYKMLGFYLLKTLQIEVVEAVRLFSVHSTKCNHDSKKGKKEKISGHNNPIYIFIE